MAPGRERGNPDLEALTRRHLRIGWSGLLVFLSLGIGLETLHGLKAGFYLDARNETRRLMWTLAHVHGTLFSLIHIALAVSLQSLTDAYIRPLRLVSAAATGALIAMPAGFFLGGVTLFGGDPGPGVFIVPLGAILMLTAVATFLLVLHRSSPPASATRETQPAAGSGPSKRTEGRRKPGDRKR